jgi:hypothetical protein
MGVKTVGAERSRTIFFSSPIARPDEPSEAAKRKIARRQSVDGTPIMAWHDLIANLGTLTINDVKLPIAEGRTLHMLARPTLRSSRSWLCRCPGALADGLRK